MELVTLLFLIVILAFIVKWVWDRHTILQTWKRQGIPGPGSASLLMGNLGEIVKKGTFVTIAEWSKKYGKVFGYYQSCTPVLVTSDPDVAREILIKQFNKFSDRWMVLDQTKVPFNSIVDQGGEQWKKVRGLSSPTFSGKRMKQMSPLVHKSIDKLVALLDDKAEKEEAFDIAYAWKRMALDVIASTVFSYDTDVFNQENNKFLEMLAIVFNSLDPDRAGFAGNLRLVTAALLPGLVTFIRKFHPTFISTPNEWFLELAKRMIEDRLDTGEFRPDYIQLMLLHGRGGRLPSTGSGTETDTEGSEDEAARDVRTAARDLRHQAKSKELTMEEMQGQIFTFLAAGYETTATTLGYFSYYMALNPEIQAKLQNEIDDFFPDIKRKPVNYETVRDLPYLDMVFCETSRLASIGQIAVSRMCSEDADVCGYRIPKGAKVQINTIEIHRDPELWGPEPVEDFVPERFTKERKGSRHPMAYLAFGSGPRNCIGMRFAIMEAKMAIINALTRFSIVRCEETQVPLKVTQHGIHGPAHGVMVKVVKRD